MNEFLKPSRTKIIIFAVIFILGEFLLLTSFATSGELCKMLACPDEHKLMWQTCSNCGPVSLADNMRTAATFILNPGRLVFGNDGSNYLPSLLASELISLFYWYVLASCIALALHKKN